MAAVLEENLNQSLQTIISNAMKTAGFSGQLSGKIFITLDCPPLFFALHGEKGDKAEDKYNNRIQSVAGVESDEGQVSGYQFEIDLDEFTVKSEQQLIQINKRYSKYRDHPLATK